MSLKRIACLAWLSFKRCFRVLACFSGSTSMSWTSTDLISIAVPGLPPRKRGSPKGLEKVENDEYMTVSLGINEEGIGSEGFEAYEKDNIV